MAEYIEREALIEHIKDLPTWTFVAKADGAYEKVTKYPEGMFNCDDVIASIENAPAADVVSLAVFEQVKWERDTALQTLEEHGIGFAQKADVVEVVRCKECKHYTDFDVYKGKRFTFHFCFKFNNITEENDFCSYGERRKEDA